MSAKTVSVAYMRDVDGVYVADDRKRVNDAYEQYKTQISRAYIQPSGVADVQSAHSVMGLGGEYRPKPVTDRSGLPFSCKETASAYFAMRDRLEKAYIDNG
jgi:hypothetical protein